MSGHEPAIRRSIWYVLFCCPDLAKGHMYDLELFFPCLYDKAGRAGVRLELPLYPDRVVVGQPHCAMLVRAPVPRHRTEVAICASGNFWLGASGRILRLLGHQSIYR